MTSAFGGQRSIQLSYGRSRDNAIPISLKRGNRRQNPGFSGGGPEEYPRLGQGRAQRPFQAPPVSSQDYQFFRPGKVFGGDGYKLSDEVEHRIPNVKVQVPVGKFPA